MATVQPLLLAFLGVVALVEGRFFPLQADNKIVNGYEIDISLVPWQVALLVDNKQNCGGSIISPQWVLTAAHCTYNYQVCQLQIRIGSNSSIEGGMVYQIEKMVNHEKYDSNRYMDDISLMKTTKDMKLEHPLKSVTLPKLGAKRPPVNTTLLVSGWGRKECGVKTSLLMAVEVAVREYEECAVYGGPDKTSQICAGSPGKGSCGGDSGGPLVQGDLLVGVAIFVADCLPCGTLPGGYTDVAFYRQWIQTHTGL